MRNAVADYAIPRSQLAKAKARDTKYNSTEAVTALVEQARRSFTDLAKLAKGVRCFFSCSRSDFSNCRKSCARWI
jgi:hypothetical protein